MAVQINPNSTAFPIPHYAPPSSSPSLQRMAALTPDTTDTAPTSNQSENETKWNNFFQSLGSDIRGKLADIASTPLTSINWLKPSFLTALNSDFAAITQEQNYVLPPAVASQNKDALTLVAALLISQKDSRFAENDQSQKNGALNLAWKNLKSLLKPQNDTTLYSQIMGRAELLTMYRILKVDGGAGGNNATQQAFIKTKPLYLLDYRPDTVRDLLV